MLVRRKTAETEKQKLHDDLTVQRGVLALELHEARDVLRDILRLVETNSTRPYDGLQWTPNDYVAVIEKIKGVLPNAQG